MVGCGVLDIMRGGGGGNKVFFFLLAEWSYDDQTPVSYIRMPLEESMDVYPVVSVLCCEEPRLFVPSGPKLGCWFYIPRMTHTGVIRRKSTY